MPDCVVDGVAVDMARPRVGEVRVTNAKTGGQKGSKSERFDLIPAIAMRKVARLYGRGALKYAAHNWRKGYDWSLSIAALERHLAAFKEGEDFDGETQCEHLASVVFHALALLTYADEHPELDDRWKPEGTHGTSEPGSKAAGVREVEGGTGAEGPVSAQATRC